MAGAAVGLFAMNGLVAARPLAWVEPPIAARAMLYYLLAVWGFGSIVSALPSP